MTPEKRALIEELAGIAHDKSMLIEAWGMRNVSSDPVKRKKWAIENAVAQAEYREAEDALRKAMQP